MVRWRRLAPTVALEKNGRGEHCRPQIQGAQNGRIASNNRRSLSSWGGSRRISKGADSVKTDRVFEILRNAQDDRDWKWSDDWLAPTGILQNCEFFRAYNEYFTAFYTFFGKIIVCQQKFQRELQKYLPLSSAFYRKHKKHFDSCCTFSQKIWSGQRNAHLFVEIRTKILYNNGLYNALMARY